MPFWREWKHGGAVEFRIDTRHNAVIKITNELRVKRRVVAPSRALEGELDRLRGDQIFVRLERIANMVGDAHTFVRFPADRAPFPLQLARFGSDYRVVAVKPGDEQLLRGRLLGINDTPVERVIDALKLITPAAETDELRLARIEGFLTIGMVASMSSRLTASPSDDDYVALRPSS